MENPRSAPRPRGAMRYVIVVLVALTGACNTHEVTSPQGHVQLLAASVSRTVLHAGDLFFTSETALLTNCGPSAELWITYAGKSAVSSAADTASYRAMEVSETAVLGDTTVDFGAECNAQVMTLKQLIIQVQ